MTTRADAQALDDQDPIAPIRDLFELPDGIIYLDGNSLGALPKHVAARMQQVVSDEWGQNLIRSWNAAGWSDMPKRVGDRLGRLIGAEPDSVIVCDTTSVNLYKAASAAAAMSDRPVILTDEGNFPTDVYILQSVAKQHRKTIRMWDPTTGNGLDSDVAFVSTTEVNYRTGYRHDIAAITTRAHEVGALAIWDLAHSAGAFPLRMAEAQVDFAVGCGYKFLNGGPGAPAFIYIAPRHLGAFENPMTGWWGHARPFDMTLDFEPHPGIDRARVGTPHLLSLAGLDAALDVFDQLEMTAVRTKSLALTTMFMDLVTQRLPDIEIETPRDPAKRASQVSLRHPHAFAVVQALIERGVIGDFRNPDIARFGVAAPYIRFVDVFDAVEHLTDIMRTDAWRDERFGVRHAVT